MRNEVQIPGDTITRSKTFAGLLKPKLWANTYERERGSLIVAFIGGLAFILLAAFSVSLLLIPANILPTVLASMVAASPLVPAIIAGIALVLGFLLVTLLPLAKACHSVDGPDACIEQPSDDDKKAPDPDRATAVTAAPNERQSPGSSPTATPATAGPAGGGKGAAGTLDHDAPEDTKKGGLQP